MARPIGIRVDKICNNCEIHFEVPPYKEKQTFCSNKCAQQFKGKDKSWLNKREETCLNKYGTKNAFQSEQVQINYKKSMMDKHGVENPFSLQETRDKAKNVLIEKYGFPVASQNKDIGDKISKALKGREMNRENFSEVKYEKILSYCKIVDLTPMFDKEIFIDNKVNVTFKNKFDFKCNKCDSNISVMLGGGYLPACKCSNYKGYSLIEEELVRFVYEHFNEDEVHLNRRDILPNRLELDIYIPKYNIAIEMNGIYWHSESMGKYRDYHLFKTEKCEEKDIRLIHILDHEWRFKKDIIKSILTNVFKKNKSIYARKCVLKHITDTKIIREFLDQNHIQGYTHAKINLGLYYNDELMSVMTFGKNRFKKNSNEYEMVRFCNKLNFNIIGGASKLFKHFIKHHNVEQYDVISFADRRFFNGGLYKTLGFEFEKNTFPSYIYWKNFEIKNRMSCQKHKLSKLLDIFDNELTEYENMKNNGWRRVWDSGNGKWKFNY
jgi:hypothetical protein